MKIRAKTLVSVAAALSLSCSMVLGYANTAAFTKVEVDQGSTGTFTEHIDGFAGLTVTPQDLVRVTIKLSEGETAVQGAEATFFSYLQQTESDTVYNNDTIQFVDQATTASAPAEGDETAPAAGTIQVTFRPRTTIGSNGAGTFVAKAGGTGVAAPAEGTYTVATASKALTLTAGSNVSIFSDDLTTNPTFTLEGFKETELNSLSVKLGDTALNESQYSFDKDATNDSIILTIMNAAIDKTVGSKTVTVSAAGYTDATGTIEVKAAVQPEIPDDQIENAAGALETALEGVSANPKEAEVILPSNITVDTKTYDITYGQVVPSSGAVTYDEATNTVTYDPESDQRKFVDKITFVAQVGNEKDGISEKKTIYFIPDVVTLSFGNVTAITTADGQGDAFASDDTMKGIGNADMNEARAEALNVALGRKTLNDIADGTNTLDFVKDGTFHLSEYRIFKIMTEGNNPDYTVQNVLETREKYNN